MAIPISELQKQLNTPNTAKVTAPDLTQSAAQLSRANSANQAALGQLAEGGTNLYQRWSRIRAQEECTAAQLDYNQELTKWNTWLAQHEGEARTAAQPRYEAELARAKDAFVSRVDKIPFPDIREQTKANVSVTNIRNAQEYQMRNYQNESDIEQSKMQQLTADELRNTISLVNAYTNADSLKNYADKFMQSVTNSLVGFYSGRKGEPEEIVAQRLKDLRTNAVIAIATRANQTTARLDATAGGYDKGDKLINKYRKAGLINEDQAVEALRKLQEERLSLAVIQHPDKFINPKTGDYYREYARTIANDLTPYELEKTISSSSKSNDGSSVGEREMANAISGNAWQQEVIDNISKATAEFFSEEDVGNYFGGKEGAENTKKDSKKYLNDTFFGFGAANANDIVTSLRQTWNSMLSYENMLIDVDGNKYKTQDGKEFARAKGTKTYIVPEKYREKAAQVRRNIAYFLSTRWNKESGGFNIASNMKLSAENTQFLNAISNELRKSYDATGGKLEPFVGYINADNAISNTNLAISYAKQNAKQKDPKDPANKKGVDIDLTQPFEDYKKNNVVYMLDKNGEIDDTKPINFEDLQAFIYTQLQAGTDGLNQFNGMSIEAKQQAVLDFAQIRAAKQKRDFGIFDINAEYEKQRQEELRDAASLYQGARAFGEHGFFGRRAYAVQLFEQEKGLLQVNEKYNNPEFEKETKAKIAKDLQSKQSQADVVGYLKQDAKLITNLTTIEMNTPNALVANGMFATESQAEDAKYNAMNLRYALKEINNIKTNGIINNKNVDVVKVNYPKDVFDIRTSIGINPDGLVQNMNQPLNNVDEILSRASYVNKANKDKKYLAIDIGDWRTYVFSRLDNGTYKFEDYVQTKDAEKFYSTVILNEDINTAISNPKTTIARERFKGYISMTGLFPTRYVANPQANMQKELAMQAMAKKGSYTGSGMYITRPNEEDFQMN